MVEFIWANHKTDVLRYISTNNSEDSKRGFALAHMKGYVRFTVCGTGSCDLLNTKKKQV